MGSPEDDSRDLWEERRFRLFLSHTSAHAGTVAALKNKLTQHLIDGFVAHEDIKPTKEWDDVITIATAPSVCWQQSSKRYGYEIQREF